MFKAKIDVTLKKSILDPQGKAVLAELHTMSFNDVTDVRVGKFCELTLDAANKDEADKQIHEICDKLLVNPVIEEYSYTLEEI